VIVSLIQNNPKAGMASSTGPRVVNFMILSYLDEIAYGKVTEVV
jgi:hypothetical protein